MSKTVDQVVSWVDQMIPNVVDTTTKYVFVEDIWKTIKDYNTEYVVSDTTPTASSQAIYSLPTGISWSDLLYVGISPTTFNSTNIVGSTTPFVEYRYKSWKNEVTGTDWYEVSSSRIAISSVPDNAYHMQFKYLPSLVCNASSDSTTVIPGNDDMVDYIQNKLASQIAKYGAFPRIDVANNYELEAQDKLIDVKIASKKFRWRRMQPQISYKEWW